MEMKPSFNSYIEQSIIKHWDKDALSDYKGTTLQYHDVARKIEKLHILFESGGIRKGDKIAICGRNSANWAVTFLATLSYGAVAVPIQHEFKPEQIYNIVSHSGAKLLFVGDIVATTLDYSQLPEIEGVFYLPDNSLIISHNDALSFAREHLNELFGRKFPKYFRKEHVHYVVDAPEDLAIINYTSGTTGFSKGVMIPYRALTGNLSWTLGELGKHVKPGNVLAILPMAHMYGLMVEFLFNFAFGNHIYFLTRLPSPTIIQQAFADVKPVIIASVPLIVEKIVRKHIFPLVQNSRIKLLMSMPVISKKVKERIREYVYNVFGGNLYEIIIGGAGLNKEVEQFLYDIEFPFTVGYGTTETAPMISYSDYNNFVPGSCGTPVTGMSVRVASDDPEHVAGEIITRGINVMQGYYHNPEATKAVFDDDGWFHTGDLGTMASDGHIFIRGRIKNMLLGSNGQNIYPEEIEDKLNSMALVNESLVIQDHEQLVALVHPDAKEAEELGFSSSDIEDIMEQNRRQLNAALPSFCKIEKIRIQEKEFEKTPKNSIKRYLYTKQA